MRFQHSIRRQIAAAFIGVVALCMFLTLLCTYLFLERYYVAKKSKILKTCAAAMGEQKNFADPDQDFLDFCYNNNLSFVVVNKESSSYYSNGHDGERMASRLFGYITGIDAIKPDILQKGKNYVIQENKDIRGTIRYLEMWGILDANTSYMIRSPLESIKESVSLASKFFLYFGLGAVVIAACASMLVTRRLTRPLLELTDISKRMAALDFEARYESGGDDEIGILGHNFNTMSQKLELAISDLKSANNELEKDIEQKTKIDEMRKEFLANVSHELKTPIALIQGYAEGLQDNINEDKESRDFYCDVIVDEARKMNGMVRKLLTLNQLEFGQEQVSMQCFDICRLVEGIINANSLPAAQKGASIYFHGRPSTYVWGDEFKVEEVVTNYITNALNHVKYDKKIDIRLRETEGKVRLSVFNTGDPIPDQDMDRIWDKFYKVDKARTRAYGGSGIGLSIVKAIMESMHQSYGCRNFENGVEFWFELEAKAKISNEECV